MLRDTDKQATGTFVTVVGEYRGNDERVDRAKDRIDFAAGGQVERLKAQCDSQLERYGLDFLDHASLRLPDKAQHRIDACGTAVADFYDSDAGAAFDSDGKHQDSADIAARAAAITCCLEDAGLPWCAAQRSGRHGWR